MIKNRKLIKLELNTENKFFIRVSQSGLGIHFFKLYISILGIVGKIEVADEDNGFLIKES